MTDAHLLAIDLQSAATRSAFTASVPTARHCHRVVAMPFGLGTSGAAARLSAFHYRNSSSENPGAKGWRLPFRRTAF